MNIRMYYGDSEEFKSLGEYKEYEILIEKNNNGVFEWDSPLMFVRTSHDIRTQKHELMDIYNTSEIYSVLEDYISMVFDEDFIKENPSVTTGVLVFRILKENDVTHFNFVKYGYYPKRAE